MDRAAQLTLLAATAALGWLLMQVFHEAGHLLHAVVSGATVERVVLHPLTSSRTVLASNPHPLFVAWGGAIWGCLLPLALALAAHRLAPALTGVARAIAGLCLLANGVYLGAGGFVLAGDAGDLLLAGAARWQLVAFGVLACAGGLALWNRLGPRFAAPVDRRLLGGVVACAVTLAVVEALLSLSA